MQKALSVHYIVNREYSITTQIQKKFQIDYDIKVSLHIIWRIFKRNNLKSVIKTKKLLLTDRHKKACFEFAKKYKNWNYDDWYKVVWSDESKFNLFKSDGREYYWKWLGELLKDQHVKGIIKFGEREIFIWGYFMTRNIKYLCKIEGDMDATLYIQILEKNLLETLNYYEYNINDIIFQYDNDLKYKTCITKTWLKDNNILVLNWPA